MSLIQQLHQEEKSRNYKKFCEIADRILASKDSVVSPVLKKQMRVRRDFYLSRLLHELPNSIDIFHIAQRLTSESLELLQKCCPSLNRSRMNLR